MTKNFILAWRWLGLPTWHRLKNLPANAGNARDLGLIPGSGRSPEVGNGNPLQYSCPGNPMDRGDCWATVDGIAESWTQLSACACRHTHTHTRGQGRPLPHHLPISHLLLFSKGVFPGRQALLHQGEVCGCLTVFLWDRW